MSSRTALSPVMSSPGRPRAERGGRPEPAMMMAPALPCPAALDSVLRTAAIPAALAVARGRPVADATAAAPAVVAAVWKKLLKAPAISWLPASAPELKTLWMARGAETVLKVIQKASTRTPKEVCREYALEVGSRYLKVGSVMKSRIPWVISAATPQPSGHRRTPARFSRYRLPTERNGGTAIKPMSSGDSA